MSTTVSTPVPAAPAMTRQDLINNLRTLASVLEEKPEMAAPFNGYLGNLPAKLSLRSWLINLEDLKRIARSLRSFKKRYNDDYFEIFVDLTPTLELVWYCDRSKVCKLKKTWDCEDAESVLRDLNGPDAAQQEVEVV